MLSFKEWLLLEDDDGAPGGDFFYGLQLYPSDAFDGAAVRNHPHELMFLQNRWRIERKQGRKFYNLDDKAYRKIDFVTVSSTDMPDTTPGHWQHKPSNRPSLKIDRIKKFDTLAVAKSSKPELNQDLNRPVEINLDRIFGDQGTGKPQTIPADIDRPWTKVYENITPYQVFAPGRDDINYNMGYGVRSRMVGPDETNPSGEDGDQGTKFANFGFSKRPRKYFKKYFTKPK